MITAISSLKGVTRTFLCCSVTIFPRTDPGNCVFFAANLGSGVFAARLLGAWDGFAAAGMEIPLV
ncbi:MAG: hypothetical protein WCF44_01770 [Candidatus Methylophosphatis roskildensis]